MKKILTRSVMALLVAVFLFGSTSCIGSFSLTNRLLGWNRNVSNKFVNELVFFAFWILPVYEVSGLADLLVLNTIEFWSGQNPAGDVSQVDRVVKASNGDNMLVRSDANGYEITNLATNESCRLDYEADINGWSMTTNGERHILFTFVDDTHVRMPLDGTDQWMTVELSQDGLMAYAAQANPVLYAMR